jgi:copper(I)-binding protein
MKLTHLIAAISLCVAALGAAAQDFSVGELVVHSPWARPLPPVAENGAAYLSVTNHAMHPDRLISGSTPIAERVEFHTHVKSGSMMMMRKLDAVDIGAHDTVTMRPGGMHVMLLGLQKPLVANESFPLTLTFAKAGSTTVTVLVEMRAATTGAPAMKHATPAMKHGKHTN